MFNETHLRHFASTIPDIDCIDHSIQENTRRNFHPIILDRDSIMMSPGGKEMQLFVGQNA